MPEIIVFAHDPNTGISCGINAYGELYLGGNGAGYNLPDTPENREIIMSDFAFWTKEF